MLDTSYDLLFPGKFPTNPLTVFRRIVVSSEKITCSQCVALFYFEPVFSLHFDKRNSLDKGRLCLTADSFKHHCIVLSLAVTHVFLNWFAMSRSVTNVCCSAREKQFTHPLLGVVPHGQPDRIESIKSSDCYFIIVTSHLSVFAIAA